MDHQAKEMMEQRKFREFGFIVNSIKERIDASADMSVVNYISTIVSSLIKTKTTDKDEYVSELTPFTNMLSNFKDQNTLIDYLWRITERY